MSDLHPDTPDVAGLRRRVLAVGALSLLLFVVGAFVISELDVPSAWLLLYVGVLYLAVIRPLMAPVRTALQLRRRLAYQAFLDQRPDRDER
jgi:hypothetical protein